MESVEVVVPRTAILMPGVDIDAEAFATRTLATKLKVRPHGSAPQMRVGPMPELLPTDAESVELVVRLPGKPVVGDRIKLVAQIRRDGASTNAARKVHLVVPAG